MLFRRTPLCDLSGPELDVGFAVIDAGGIRVAALVVGEGQLIAMKMRTRKGVVEYVVCDRVALEPILVACDLNELLARYHQTGSAAAP